MIRDGWAPDRRRGHRRMVPLSLRALVEGGDEPMRVRELSAGGMVMEAAGPLVAGKPLSFHLALDLDTVGPLQGRVAHSRLLLPKKAGQPPWYLAGVTFEHVDAGQGAGIARLLATIEERRTGRTQDPS